jgi:hypothetical protein
MPPNFQESTLTIMHFQHVKRYSLVPVNFSFLLHILQRHIIFRCCLFLILRDIWVFVAVFVVVVVDIIIIFI